MKKLLAILIVLSLCLCSCQLLGLDGIGQCEGNAHVDSDNDGKCDRCSVSVIVVIDLYNINDLHGKIKPSSSQSGIGGLTSYLRSTADENSILMSSGDMWQGSAESNLTYGAFITDWMSGLGFASMTLGNHEYDWNESHISDNAALATFPILGINVYDKTTGERADYAAPSVVVSRGGIEVGIIGAIGDCYSSISGDVSGNFEFKVRDELTELVKAESKRLKEQGVDLIVYSLHDGYDKSSTGEKFISDSTYSSYYDTELSDGYVDIVFEAHTHQTYTMVDSHGVYHLQGGGENKGVSHAEVDVNSANGNVKVKDVEIIKANKWNDLPDDPLVNVLLSKYADVIGRADEILGNNASYLDDAVVEQIVADLYYEYGKRKWGDDYTVTLGGGFIRTRNPYNLKSGTITYADVYSILPFDNHLVLCTIKGSDLYYKFLTTTNDDYYVSSDIDLEELKNSIDMKATYYIVTDTYTSTYSYNNLTEVARYDTDTFARDLFAQYVREGNLD